jgi:hypothetical protein
MEDTWSKDWNGTAIVGSISSVTADLMRRLFFLHVIYFDQKYWRLGSIDGSSDMLAFLYVLFFYFTSVRIISTTVQSLSGGFS